MKIKFEFPIEIKKFAKKEEIKIKEIKDKILSVIDKDLLNKDYKLIKCKEIKVIINGIYKTQKNKTFISPRTISKKKPLRTVSWLLNGYSIYYLIFKKK